MKLRPDQASLLAAAAVTFAVWAVPWLRPIGLPLQYLNTIIHELCHAFATVLTGGGVGVINVYADGSGVTESYGGALPVIASAGYMGTALVGTALVAGSRTVASARQALTLAGVLVTAGCGIWLRADLIGLLAALVWILAFFLALRAPDGDWIRWVGQFLGIQLALTSVQAFQALFAVAHAGEHSDALLMEEATRIPAVFWATVWLGISLTGICFGLYRAWTAPKPKRERMPWES